jgi:hypothetical protein
MQVVGKHSEAGVAVVAGLAFVRATIQSVVLRGLNIALNGTVGVGLFTPLFVFLPLPIFGGEFAFFGHDDLGDAELQELPVFDAAKAAVEADANKRSGGEGAEEFVGEGDHFGAFVAAGHDFIMMDEVILIGGDEEAAPKLNTGAAFAFGDPFGVLFKESCLLAPPPLQARAQIRMGVLMALFQWAFLRQPGRPT